jgi:hypothetical protein
MRPLGKLVLAALLGAAAGCGGCREDPGRVSCVIRDANSDHKGNLLLDEPSFMQVGEGADAIRVDLRGGRLSVNGKDGGEVKAGDSVRVDEKGQLTVNGQRRDLK